MPIIKSAIERVKTNEKANARNSAELSKMRTAIKKFEKAKTAGAEDVEAKRRTFKDQCDLRRSVSIIASS